MTSYPVRALAGRLVTCLALGRVHPSHRCPFRQARSTDGRVRPTRPDTCSLPNLVTLSPEPPPYRGCRACRSTRKNTSATTRRFQIKTFPLCRQTSGATRTTHDVRRQTRLLPASTRDRSTPRHRHAPPVSPDARLHEGHNDTCLYLVLPISLGHGSRGADSKDPSDRLRRAVGSLEEAGGVGFASRSLLLAQGGRSV